MDREHGLRRFASVAEKVSESQEWNIAEQLDGKRTNTFTLYSIRI